MIDGGLDQSQGGVGPPIFADCIELGISNSTP